jgi:hypothetical protein
VRHGGWHRCGLPVEVTFSVDRELRAGVTCLTGHTPDEIYDGLITDRDGQLVDVIAWPNWLEGDEDDARRAEMERRHDEAHLRLTGEP